MHEGSKSPRRNNQDGSYIDPLKEDKKIPRRREKIIEAQNDIELMEILLSGKAVEYCYNAHYGVYITFFPADGRMSQKFETGSDDISVLIQDRGRQYSYDPVGKDSPNRRSVDTFIDSILETVRRFQIAREAIPTGNFSDESLLESIRNALIIESYILHKRDLSSNEGVVPAAEYKGVDTKWSPLASLPSDMDRSFLDDKRYPQATSHVLEAIYSGTYDAVLEEPGAISYELSSAGYPNAVADIMEEFIRCKRKEFLHNIGVAFKPDPKSFNLTKPSRY